MATSQCLTLTVNTFAGHEAGVDETGTQTFSAGTNNTLIFTVTSDPSNECCLLGLLTMKY